MKKQKMDVSQILKNDSLMFSIKIGEDIINTFKLPYWICYFQKKIKIKLLSVWLCSMYHC